MVFADESAVTVGIELGKSDWKKGSGTGECGNRPPESLLEKDKSRNLNVIALTTISDIDSPTAMRIVLTGVTGVGAFPLCWFFGSRHIGIDSDLTHLYVAAGLATYRAALNDPDVEHITLLTRRAVPSWAKLPPNAAEKTEVVLHSDFKTYPPDLAARLASHDAFIWALGKSSAGMSEEEYTELTLGYTLAAARALKDAGAGSAEKPFRFVYISGELADPTGESRKMGARVKVRLRPSWGFPRRVISI